ncbi:MAG: hypothetical protein M5U28_14650 [Sandaracinaceae bacterium]|nr:hypothetical protein [Sandaracinaceae bacterium]
MGGGTIFAKAGHYSVAVSGDVVVSYWRRAGDGAARSHVIELQRRCGRRINVLVVIEPTAMLPPDDEDRSNSVSALKQSSPDVHATAWVVLGEGFKAAMARSAISGWNLVSRPPGPTKVFATVADAAAWLSNQAGSASAGDLVRAVDDARAALE